MVATTNIAGLPIPEDDDEGDVPADMYDLGVALDPKVIPQYATIGERDSAYAAAIAGNTPYAKAQRGMRCYVQAGPGGFGDWCGWNGSEWLWDNPPQVGYDSGFFAGTSVTWTTYSGHNPSIYTFTPSRSGFADVRLYTSAKSGVPGYGTGFIIPRYSGGATLPGGYGFSVIDERPAEYRFDMTHIYPYQIYLVKGQAVTLAFDTASFNAGGAFWVLLNAKWIIIQR